MDGIIGASIKTTTDLFNKLVAINATGISRRSLLAMVLAGDGPSTEEDLNDEEAPNIEDIGEIADDNEEEQVDEMIIMRRRRPRLHNIVTIVNVSLRTRMIAVMMMMMMMIMKAVDMDS